MENKERLHCSVCLHLYVEQGNLNTKIRYCPSCFKFTDTMLIKINVEDVKHK